MTVSNDPEPTHEELTSVGMVREQNRVVADFEIRKIYDYHGRVDPELLLSVASDPDHPLHGRFEWDDAVAAHEHRLRQARAMLVASKVVKEIVAARGELPRPVVETVQLRALIPVFKNEGFQPREKVLADEAMRRTFVEKQLGVLRSWAKSVADVEELAPLRTKVLALLAETLI